MEKDKEVASKKREVTSKKAETVLKKQNDTAESLSKKKRYKNVFDLICARKINYGL